MPDFTFINRRGGAPWIYAWNTDDKTPGWDDHGGDGGRHSYGHPDRWVPAYQFRIEGIEKNRMITKGWRWANLKFYIESTMTYGPYTYPAQVPLVITDSEDGDADHMFRDLNATLIAVDNELAGKVETPENVLGDKPDDAGQVVAEIASAVLGGLSAALAASGPKFAPLAGGTGGLGILSALLGDSYPKGKEVPDPPSLPEIKKAVSDALSLNNARIAGTYFQSLYLWFTRKAREIDYFHEREMEIPPKLKDDFVKAVDLVLQPTSTGSFYNQLMYVSKNTDVGRYILSELLLGIGLYVHLMRINIGQTYIEYAHKYKRKDGVIPPSEIGDLKNDVDNLRTNFDKARTAFKEMRAEIVQRYGFANTPEGIFIIKKVSEFYVGEPYAVRDDDHAKRFPNGCQVNHDGNTEWISNEKGYQQNADPTSDAYNTLGKVASDLNEDYNTVKNGEWPQRLFNVDWSKELLPA